MFIIFILSYGLLSSRNLLLLTKAQKIRENNYNKWPCGYTEIKKVKDLLQGQDIIIH